MQTRVSGVIGEVTGNTKGGVSRDLGTSLARKEAPSEHQGSVAAWAAARTSMVRIEQKPWTERARARGSDAMSVLRSSTMM